VPTREAASPPPTLAGVLRPPSLRRAARDDWAQLVRFCAVGASGYVINLAVFSALFILGGAHHLLAAVGAFCVAWCSNFVVNKWWTFRRHALPAHLQAARYLLVSLLGLGLNLIVLQLLVQAGLRETLAQATAIAAVVPVNFLLNRRWSFR
jgi:putative flippase GtrA